MSTLGTVNVSDASFWTGIGVVLETDNNFGDPEAFVATGPLKFSLISKDPLQVSFLLNYIERHNFGYSELLR